MRQPEDFSRFNLSSYIIIYTNRACPNKPIYPSSFAYLRELDKDNPLYTDTRYTDKIRYNDNLTVTKPSLKRQQFVRIASILTNIQNMFFEEIRTKQDLSYMSSCSLTIPYNSKFILMATSLGTNTVVVTRVYCTLGRFSTIFVQGRPENDFLRLLVFVTIHKLLSEKESTLKGKNLLPEETTSLALTLFRREQKQC